MPSQENRMLEIPITAIKERRYLLPRQVGNKNEPNEGFVLALIGLRKTKALDATTYEQGIVKKVLTATLGTDSCTVLEQPFLEIIAEFCPKEEEDHFYCGTIGEADFVATHACSQECIKRIQRQTK